MHFIRRDHLQRWEFLHAKLRDHCAVPVLLEMLEGDDERARNTAADALGEVGDARAVAPLAA